MDITGRKSQSAFEHTPDTNMETYISACPIAVPNTTYSLLGNALLNDQTCKTSFL